MNVNIIEFFFWMLNILALYATYELSKPVYVTQGVCHPNILLINMLYCCTNCYNIFYFFQMEQYSSALLFVLYMAMAIRGIYKNRNMRLRKQKQSEDLWKLTSQN